jgi:anti-sigma B factor antagonist
MAEGLNIKTDYYAKNNNIVIIELDGYVDQTNSGQIERIIHDLLKNGKRKLVFDMSKLIYMSSAGWGIFVGDVKMLRDEGGDLVLAAMTPEVYEVYQMLEFFHIIEDYLSVEDALSSLNDGLTPEADISQETDSSKLISKSDDPIVVKKRIKSNVVKETEDDDIVIETEDIQELEEEVEEEEEEEVVESELQVEFQPIDYADKIDMAKLPLNEKIRKVASAYPLLNIFEIRKMLQHEKFGYTRVGIVKLYHILKFLNLETKAKRYRYYRSV